jgi:hypothetical protein
VRDEGLTLRNLAFGRHDDGLDGQLEALGVCVVALVVRGHGHDRAGAVLHEHVVRDPYRQPVVVHRIRDETAGEDAGLLLVRVGPLSGRASRGVADVVEDLLLVRSALGQAADQGMLGREDEEGRAEERVRPRREDGNVDVELFDAEHDLGTLRAADPVALHGQHALRPGLELRHVVEKPVRIGGDAEEPLLQGARLDLPAAALAVAVDHLLVREDGLIVRAPVDYRVLAIRESSLEELQEEPLRPVVVAGLGGRELATPVDRPAEPLHLLADRGDVAVRHVPRMAALANCRVLSGKAERVVADRPQDGEAPPAADVRNDVSERVVEHVAHVQLAGRIREHLEHVRVPMGCVLGRGVGNDESAFALPFGLPLDLDRLGIVAVHQRPTRLALDSRRCPHPADS